MPSGGFMSRVTDCQILESLDQPIDYNRPEERAKMLELIRKNPPKRTPYVVCKDVAEPKTINHATMKPITTDYLTYALCGHAAIF